MEPAVRIGLMLVVFFGFWSALGFMGGWIAEQKNRKTGEGFVLGALLGPLGWIIEALLPTIPQPSAAEVERIETLQHSYHEQEAQHQEKEHEGWIIEQQQREREPQERAKMAYVRRKARSAWIKNNVIHWVWYKDLSDLSQALLLGLLIAVPVVIVLILVVRSARH
jgi:hypothetical protein